MAIIIIVYLIFRLHRLARISVYWFLNLAILYNDSYAHKYLVNFEIKRPDAASV